MELRYKIKLKGSEHRMPAGKLGFQHALNESVVVSIRFKTFPVALSENIHYRLVGDRMHFRGREKARGRAIPKEKNLENRVISEVSTFLFAILSHIRCGI